MPRRKPYPSGSTRARGYGHAHQQLRRQWAKKIATGQVQCAREGCGRPILPGQLWDLGHDDHDRTRYRGPEHRSCNRRAGQAKAAANRRHRASLRPTKATSLRW